MTEKQGGSDVRANRTKATHQEGDVYTLTGHKWFCSAPMSDGFFTLAYTDKGRRVFWFEISTDGSMNRLYIQRLKDKVETVRMLLRRLNTTIPGQYGLAMKVEVKHIIEMVHHTRLDCTTATVGLMRSLLCKPCIMPAS